MALPLLLGALGEGTGGQQPDRETRGVCGREGERRGWETGEGQRKEKTVLDYKVLRPRHQGKWVLGPRTGWAWAEDSTKDPGVREHTRSRHQGTPAGGGRLSA